MLNKIQRKFQIQGSVVRTTTDNGANFISSFKFFGQPTLQVLEAPNPEVDAIREELQSMSQQADKQDMFVLEVEDAFPTTVADSPPEPAPEPIQLHDCAAKALFSCPAIISQRLEPRITSNGPLENTEEESKII